MKRRLLSEFNFLPVAANFEVATSLKNFLVFIGPFLSLDRP
jgi:hypothetical protein